MAVLVSEIEIDISSCLILVLLSRIIIISIENSEATFESDRHFI